MKAGANHFDHWMIALESLTALEGYDTITIGHDKPVDRSAIDSTITYVKRAKAIHAPTRGNPIRGGSSGLARSLRWSSSARLDDRRQLR
jgi:hypothetical protein